MTTLLPHQSNLTVLSTTPPWFPVGYSEATFLGAGGQAEAWRARNLRTGEVVCIKRYKSAVGGDFYRELNVLLSVKSPHLVSLVDLLDGPQGQMLVMEYCSGGCVRGRLESTGTYSVREMIELGLHTVRGLQALHAQGIVHADLKPENVFIHRRVGNPHYKLADFGIARTVRQVKRTPRKFSQAYAAPELITGFAIPASDIYSLAVMLGELVGGDTRRELFPAHIPMRLVELLTKSAHPDAAQRPKIPEWLSTLETTRTNLITQNYSNNDPDIPSGDHIHDASQPDRLTTQDPDPI